MQIGDVRYRWFRLAGETADDFARSVRCAR